MPDTGDSPAAAVWGDDLPIAPGGHVGYPQDLAVGAEGRGGLEFGPLLDAMRLVQDRFVGAALPADVQVDLTARLAALSALLEDYQVGETDRVDGRRPDLPGRGSLLVVPWTMEEQTPTSMSGRVTFRRFHLGGNGAAHGGTPPLLFDDVLGKVANHKQPGVARTVNLSIDFRKITPIGVELFFESTLDKVEGRKRWTSARILNADGEILAEANALFIELKPGQQ
jgi:acyl-coenzyme A thioesterase PaaI-like protein